jgi:hypothetical protein
MRSSWQTERPRERNKRPSRRSQERRVECKQEQAGDANIVGSYVDEVLALVGQAGGGYTTQNPFSYLCNINISLRPPPLNDGAK